MTPKNQPAHSSKRSFCLVTAFGKDRPGIVAAVSQVLFQLGGNIEDASMTRLGGEFAIMLVTAFPTAIPAAKLEKSFSGHAKKLGLQISAKAIPPEAARAAHPGCAKYLVSVYGTDRPGIVARVTEALAKRKISITDLQTKVIGGSAKPVYVMLLEFQTPEALDMDELRGELDQLRQDLNVEISLQDIEAVPL